MVATSTSVDSNFMASACFERMEFAQNKKFGNHLILCSFLMVIPESGLKIALCRTSLILHGKVQLSNAMVALACNLFLTIQVQHLLLLCVPLILVDN